MALFDLPAEKVRVVQMETGGGFGGKEEYPSVIAGHAALLAWKSGRPVKLVYDRAEDMVATTKRHPSRTRHRTAVIARGPAARDGHRLRDRRRRLLHAVAGRALARDHPRVWPVLLPERSRLRGRAVATNAPPHGAFRGFGAPQSLFALERHMDRVAAAVGLTPDEFRRRNFIQTGQTSAVGQVMRDPIDMNALLDRALELSDLSREARAVRARTPVSRIEEGIGFASFMHGAGFTGSGEVHLASVVDVEADAEGQRPRAHLQHRDRAGNEHDLCADRGRRARHRRGHDRDCSAGHGDRARQRADGRLAHVHGRRQAGRNRRRGISAAARGRRTLPIVDADEFRRACAELRRGRRATARDGAVQPPPRVSRWDDAAYQGDAYGTYAWAVYVAEVVSRSDDVRESRR